MNDSEKQILDSINALREESKKEIRLQTLDMNKQFEKVHEEIRTVKDLQFKESKENAIINAQQDERIKENTSDIDGLGYSLRQHKNTSDIFRDTVKGLETRVEEIEKYKGWIVGAIGTPIVLYIVFEILKRFFK